MNSPPPQWFKVTEDQLLDIWLDGYGSGVSSAIVNLSEGATCESDANSYGTRAVQVVTGDPLAKEVIRKAIAARLRGATLPPQSLRVFGATS